MEINILISCGAGAATSTAVAVRIKAICYEHNLPVKVTTCMAAEIPSRISYHRPDLIVATVQKPPEVDIPFFSGIPYLTGIGAKELDNQILEFLKAKVASSQG